ncbi:MAG: hypothetical protein A3I07_03910 [Candidatus Doudnabacteria bacterium RIFCSPLOWO2_02_FULL_42_9]|uniref:Bacterial spore germination immunoglobulin-like domain-containing protein n=1 Tax=Candidatus Doudnabacteria bacterium RIFCSPHIGHO2_01_FULL_41_86 TaxID=1817821 RepID=A0A1F5N812_9BACT|nr:MAG: hypothetical protein A2717_03025 [Candidatus Doudnabacteria bacterium RIFCSPHIGHO2_01_FULL_41_86]OGE74668.1 MAG: hypothetical protein A3K07_02620 [Candidatus Doudnabacteria bacterium RIFCSPHIGHO2_01_43_10]OGE85027.1 MAG: hypothetical protein A3E28_04430 [Candidatus Doudnabacteria bacterium RIFCSPHIGHO2_12_FULL_42_22]OGE86468.1 MAG: hypothetical protein A3C49_04610 [Candidatus Doudnabacteria bacterium RIFCSPHIGHO2_02_FULL_42_25]OGE91930.1 MAG: hypothetical protein A2895_01375 [Candidatus
MNKRIYQIIVLALLVVIAWLLWPKLSEPQPQTVDINPDGQVFEEEEHAQLPVVLDYPLFGALVSSPMGVSGKALGSWFFEANIPVTLKDENGKVLAQQGFQAIGDWMVEGYVPFAGTLVFDPGDAEFGVLLIERDNPSGLPENDAAFAIPVRFK